jgi:hypothetical protein
MTADLQLEKQKIERRSVRRSRRDKEVAKSSERRD